MEAEIEPVGVDLTTRVNCSAAGITAKNGPVAGQGKFFLVTSFEAGCTPTQMASFAGMWAEMEWFVACSVKGRNDDDDDMMILQLSMERLG